VFYVEGPTVRLVSPGADGRIDIGALRNRGYIDVTLTVDVAGYTLDAASVTDLAPEFILSGAGLGTVRLDEGQAPVLLGSAGNDFEFRYWIAGQFAADATNTDLVTLELIAGSVSFTQNGAGPVPSASSATLDNRQWLTIDFDNVPSGFQIDPASITDLAPEIMLSYTGQNAAKTGAGTISLVQDVAPERIGETNTYRFRVTGDFASDGTQSVSLQFNDDSWSFTSSTAAVQARVLNDDLPTPALVGSVDAAVLAARTSSYIDIAFTPSVRPGGGAHTIGAGAIATFDAITLSGAGITGRPCSSSTGPPRRWGRASTATTSTGRASR
jgi:hypothetical protein